MERETSREHETGRTSFVLKTKIVTQFAEYKPPCDVNHAVSRMIASVPVEYMNGLGEIVLTSTECLSRSRRRSVTKSRNRKVRIVKTRGLYHAEWNGQLAWVEIFIDNTFADWGKKWWLRLPFVRDMMLADVLFHEIGHHIHATRRPEYREREDVADEWKEKLGSRYFRQQYRWMIPLIACLRIFRQPIERAARKAGVNVR